MRIQAILLMVVLCIGAIPFADFVVNERPQIQDEELSSVFGRSSIITTNWTASPANGWTTGGEEITITGSGFLDMAYKNVTSDGEAYTWTKTTANYVTSSGWDPSIGVDSNGTVHIVSSNMDNKDLWHSSYDGSTWTHVEIRDCEFSQNALCTNTDLVIDSNDNIHIAYFHSIYDGHLQYSMYDGTSWTNNWSKSNVENDQVSIALDANDRPHISYSKQGTNVCNKALLSYYDGSSWLTVTLDDTSTYIGCHSSIAIDSNGFVHVAYRHHGNMDMKIASNISGSWQQYNVDNGASSVGYNSAMAVDSNNELHLVYASNSAGNTAYFANGASGSAWFVSNQGTSRNMFSMYIDQFDIVHISEYNGGSDLGYSMVAPGNSRQSMTIDGVGDVGYGNDIVVDDNNMVHVAYYDSSNENLKYANRSTGMSLTQEITVQFGSYGNVTGTVVNDTTIRVTTPMAGQTADMVDITLRDKDDNEHVLSSAFTFISPDDVDMDGVLNVNDDCPNVAGTSTQDVTGCPDADGDGYSDSGDIFPADSSQWNDTDGDGYGDASNGNNSDSFPLESSQWNDTDGDGYGDNPEGDDPDSCPGEVGNSTYPGLGCLDTDGDGYADTLDAFPFNALEYLDSDQDGVGDNSDEFPFDANETMDSDGDGVGDNADAFPNDASETIDSDGDGLGDNSDPNPMIHNFVDSDGDTVPNIEDDFPFDNTQWSDVDGDGYGDNPDGNDSDDFVNNPTQWKDSDGDGFGDNPDGNDSDDFVNSPTQWKDSDGDGYGDNWGNVSWNATRSPTWPGIFVEGASFADYCPDTNGNSTTDGYYGCQDDDGNGIANMFEPIVENTTSDTGSDGETTQQTKESDYSLGSLISGSVTQTVGFSVILLALLALLQTNAAAAILPDAFRWFQVLRKNSKLSKEEENELSYLQSVVQAYFADHQYLIEELRDMKADLTARYSNNQIKKETREKLFTIIDDLMTTNHDELEHIAHNEFYFGLAETLDTKQRTALLKEKISMDQSFEEEGMVSDIIPNNDVKGTVSTDGYEYLELPTGSGNWFIRNQSSGSWERWTQ